MTRLLKPHEVAEALNVSERMVREMLTRGELPGKKIGKFWRVHPDALEKWVKGSGDNLVRLEARR